MEIKPKIGYSLIATETIEVKQFFPEFVYTEILDREFMREVFVVEPIGTFNREFTGFVYEFTGFVYAVEPPSVIGESNPLLTNKELYKILTVAEELPKKFEKLENEVKIIRTKNKEREELTGKVERLTSRFWKERMFYISIIIGSITSLLTILF